MNPRLHIVIISNISHCAHSKKILHTLLHGILIPHEIFHGSLWEMKCSGICGPPLLSFSCRIFSSYQYSSFLALFFIPCPESHLCTSSWHRESLENYPPLCRTEGVWQDGMRDRNLCLTTKITCSSESIGGGWIFHFRGVIKIPGRLRNTKKAIGFFFLGIYTPIVHIVQTLLFRLSIPFSYLY